MDTTLILSKWIIFVLSFLVCTITFINGHPNAFSYSESNWTPKTSEDDVRSRSLSHDDLTPSEDIEDFDKEYDFDGVDDDLEDDYLEYKFLTNNKRSPNSKIDKSFKNAAGYYLIEGSGGTVTGTKDLATCISSGIFEVGRTAKGPFLKNIASGNYLAIDATGGVYMSPTKNKDTLIYTSPGSSLSVYLYRIVTLAGGKKQRLYLDISPHSSTVGQSSTSNTTKFHVRTGKTTC